WGFGPRNSSPKRSRKSRGAAAVRDGFVAARRAHARNFRLQALRRATIYGMNQQNLADFIWNVADALRGNFRPSLYGRIILPFTVLRRMECVLDPTRDKVLAQHKALTGTSVD